MISFLLITGIFTFTTFTSKVKKNNLLINTLREGKYTQEKMKQITISACPRRISAGADGVIFICVCTISLFICLFIFFEEIRSLWT